MIEKTTGKGAIKLISTGKVQSVHFAFRAEGAAAWLRVPKVEAKRLLREIHARPAPQSHSTIHALVFVEIRDNEAFISDGRGIA